MKNERKKWHVSSQQTVSFSLSVWTHSALSTPTAFSSDHLKLAGPFSFRACCTLILWLLVQCQRQWCFYALHPCPQEAQMCPIRDYSRFGHCHQKIARRWAGWRCARWLFSIQQFPGTVQVSSCPYPSASILKCFVLGRKVFQSYKYGLQAALIQNIACTTQNILVKRGSQLQHVSRQEECRKITEYTSCSIITQ